MASISAQEVAKEVIKTLGKSRKPVLRKIAVEKGYSQHTADTPKNITDTKSYKDVVDPVVNRWIKERERITSTLEGKDLTKEQYKVLVDALDTITKNIQLLTGGKTSNDGMGELAETLNTWINSKK